jgi:predicted nucleic acid-binding protein
VTGEVLFLDASFWIALRDRREPWHGRARELTAPLLARRATFVFTAFVLAEVHTHFIRSPKTRIQVLNDAEHNPVMRPETVNPSDQSEAIRILRDYSDKGWSFCDAVSLVVMRRLGLRRAASFDQHFRQFGEFEIVE